ncbi:type II toxin-antitoxin system RelE/ParE family toxin, partial [Acidovorax sp. A1169]|uniref:type II toxin-antitoxin system RelE/ParE family toxin n=1 Tax=Acidovorax sp. A1169 TaxID=3059524 RepID=UPI00273800D3
LHKVQLGENPDDWKPIPRVGSGAMELRIWDEQGTFRVIYVAKIADRVHVLHAFKKKERAISQADIDLAKERYKRISKGS